MKPFLLSLLLLPLNARQQVPTAAKTDAERPQATLEIERGFVSVREGWYQDKFGLARQSATARTEALDWTVGHDDSNTVIVNIGSKMESGIKLTLRLRYDGDQVAECVATGRWRRDVGAKPSDFSGELNGVSGFVRLYSREGERKRLACLFAVRGFTSREHEKGETPDLVMGGFAIDWPFGEAAAAK